MVQQAKLGEILAALFCVGILHSQAFTIPRATATRATSVTMSASGTEATEQAKPQLIDVPVSNNGARVRMVMYYKQLEALVDVVSPVDAYGGLKTPEYLALNPQGKMPMLVVPAGDESQPGGLAPIAWAEADPIARHLIDRYAAQAPSLTGETLAQRTLCNAISRHHDAYLQPIQGAMYKATPPFGAFGSRRAALQEMQKQLVVLEGLAARAQRTNKSLQGVEADSNSNGKVAAGGGGPYLAGALLPTLADCTVYPTLVFTAFMLPRFDLDPWHDTPILKSYWQHMTERDSVGQRVYTEIQGALEKWASSGRWDTIMLAGLRDKAPPTVFDQIIGGDLPSNKVYEDDLCVAFKDVNPVAPTHVLVVPKHREGLTQLRFATPDHEAILGHLLWAAGHVASLEHLGEDYRVVINDGQKAGQSVYHLHLHVIGGRDLAWPPG